jgi:serine/threonine protein kinase
MTPNQLLCFGCMHDLTTPGEVCPHCGHDNHIRHNGPGLLGETLLGGQYQVGRVLGRGGFGVTYIGYDLNLTQCIAIKEYFPTSLVTRSKDDLTLTAISGSEASYENGLQRALKEGRMAASLRRIPGVVQVYNVLPANNTMYIIMEYVEGRTLTDYVENSPAPLTPAQAQKLLAPVADALTRLHKMDVIHRDV